MVGEAVPSLGSSLKGAFIHLGILAVYYLVARSLEDWLQPSESLVGVRVVLNPHWSVSPPHPISLYLARLMGFT